jgi:hypothetical protein
LYCANISDLKPIGEADDHCATMAQVLREWINFFSQKKKRKNESRTRTSMPLSTKFSHQPVKQIENREALG